MEWVLVAGLFILAYQLQLRSLREWQDRIQSLDLKRLVYDGVLPGSFP